MLSISEFKNKLINLVSNQENRIAQTQNGENEKADYVPEEEPDTSVMLLADESGIAFEFDDAINTTGSKKDTIAVYGDNKSVTDSDAGRQIVVVGENNKVDSKNGNDDILILGNNNTVNAGDGKSSVVFRGDNVTINTGKGNNTISSLDFAIMSDSEDAGNVPNYSKYEKFLNITTSKVTGDVIGKTYTTKEVSHSVTNQKEKETVSADVLDRLTASGRQIAQTLDFSETVPGTNLPRYVIAQGTASGQKWHIYKYQSGSDGNATYKAYGESVSTSGDLYLKLSADKLVSNDSIISGSQLQTIKVVTQDYEVDKLADYTLYTSKGNNNVTINSTGGNNKISVNASNVSYNAGNGNNDVNVLDGLKVKDSDYKEYAASEDSWRKYGSAKENITEIDSDRAGNIFSTAARAYDPIIVDFNRDGKISGSQGIGVDLDGDGKADGSASKGDKMLAMSDLNNSGEIDGGEVFGDRTVSPFTNKEINAANGFEALAKIAQEAEQYTGISCINAEGDVDLASLKQALQTVGVDLGFISEDNVTQLESLAHVASINVAKYVNVAKGVNIQTGYYTDSSGKKYNANDVWFNGGNV